MLVEVTCIVIRCDTCGRVGFDSGDGGDFDNEAHFDTIEQAEELARECQWFVGPDTATCRRCLELAECRLTGCDWSDWHNTGPHEHKGGVYVGRRRYCWRCNASEYDPPIPQPEAAAK